MPADWHQAFPAGLSLEVTPRTLAKSPDLANGFEPGTRVYIAHISGTPIRQMTDAARVLRDHGFEPMPHIPARLLSDTHELAEWVARYEGEAGVQQALLLGGGLARPTGTLHDALQLLESGAFSNFTHLHIAGHPEGSRDIDPDGGEGQAMRALSLKAAFRERSDASMAIVTQFTFDPQAVIAWADRLRLHDVTLPVHLGVAGPAKLQTLLRYAISCGIGPSLSVLQKRAQDITKLLRPIDPGALLQTLAAHKRLDPDFPVEGIHFFPLGGIAQTAQWLAQNRKT
ncbi:methylenetetrahydrofolate reductase [Rhodobacteraceae bacterium]|nr:methylenetetrahydrofolate reductase [Paracoccaceae bacterium]